MHLVNILINVGRDTDNAISVICNRSFCTQICTNTDKANFLIDFWLSLAWNEYIQVNCLIWGCEDFRRLFLPLWVSFGMLTKFASIFWKLNYVERPSRMEIRKIEGFFYCNRIDISPFGFEGENMDIYLYWNLSKVVSETKRSMYMDI